MARKRSAKFAHLPQHIHQPREGGAYHYLSPDDGTWKKVGTTMPEVHAFLADLLGGGDSATLTVATAKAKAAAGGLTMRELIDLEMPRVLKGREGKDDLSEKTKENYRQAARLLKTEWFDDNPLAKSVTAKTIAAIQDEAQDEPNLFNNCITVLRGITKFGILHDRLDFDFCAGIKMLPTTPRDRHVTHAEYLAIYHSPTASELSRIVQELAYRTTQRIGDNRRIRESQLIAKGIYFQQHKTQAEVIMQWTPELTAVVERAKAYSGWDDKVVPLKGERFLLAGRGGKAIPYETIRKAWVKAVEGSGVEDVRIHDMRAKGAGDKKRQIDMLGLDGLAHSAKMLGHGRNVATTQKHYIRTGDDDIAVVEGPTGFVTEPVSLRPAGFTKPKRGKTRKAA